MTRLGEIRKRVSQPVAAFFLSLFRKEEQHKFELKLGKRVFIVTDFGRPGVIEKRDATMFLGGTEAYYVRRGSDGVAEWYPRFSLTVEQDESAPTEVSVMLEGEQPEIGKVI